MWWQFKLETNYFFLYVLLNLVQVTNDKKMTGNKSRSALSSISHLWRLLHEAVAAGREFTVHRQIILNRRTIIILTGNRKLHFFFNWNRINEPERLTWDWDLATFFLKTPLKIPPFSWENNMKPIFNLTGVPFRWILHYCVTWGLRLLALTNLTLVVLFSERLSVLPESSPGADKSSWKPETNVNRSITVLSW